MGTRDRSVDEIIAALASRRHGVVSRRQLIEAGISSTMIWRRLRSGRLIKVHRGVYRVGHAAPSARALYMAAVLACGPGAGLRRLSSGHLLELLRRGPRVPEVIAPTERRIEGIAVSRSRPADGRDLIAIRGIPTTSVPRTLVDLAAALGAEQLARAFHEAQVRYRTTPDDVLEVLERRPTSRGAKTLRAVMLGDAATTLSGLERRFLELLSAAGLPLPLTNRPAGSKLVDCRWPEAGLTVELDSFRYHNSRHAWEQDRRRDREARARGEQLHRFTRDDVFVRPEQTVAEVRSLLGRSA